MSALKKTIPIILILVIILTGIFGMVGTVSAQVPSEESFLNKNLSGCSWTEIATSLGASSFECMVNKIIYVLFVSIPSLLLSVIAVLFNVVAALTLSSNMYDQSYISSIWAVVRDFANIFFILILLYAAIQIILDLGHGGGKKTIGLVIIIALLVNFSLFFTKIVIDSSNVVALIFYNRIMTTNTNYDPASGEKDLAGSLVSSFNVNRFFDEKTIEAARTHTVNGMSWTETHLSFFMGLGLMVIYGLVILVLCYAFFMGAFFLFSRMIMLILLMIVAPFAFVTGAVPKLKSVETIGFDSWLHKLLSTSFMAAVFMFVVYILAQILDAKVFANTTSTGILQILVTIFTPALLMIVLLLKGVSYAKKASGEFTGAVMAGAGLLAGGVLGGAAMLGSGVIGGGASRVTKKYGETLREKQEKGGWTGFAARMGLKTLNYGQKATFDARQTALGGTLAKKAGLDLQSAKVFGLGSREGGYKGTVERKEKKVLEESELYKTSMTNDEVKKWSAVRQAKYEVEKDEAKRREGASFDEEKYKREHPEPRAYTTAEELNNHRMHTFQENIGKTGFLHTLAQSSVNVLNPVTADDLASAIAKYNERVASDPVFKAQNPNAPTEKSIKEARIDVAKVVIGGGAAMATGGLAGSVIGATAVGAATGGLGALSSNLTDQGAWGKARHHMEKDMKKLEDVQKRIDDMKELLKKQTETMANGLGLGVVTDKDKNGNPLGLDSEKNPIYRVEDDKLEHSLAQETANSENISGQLQILNQRIASGGGVASDADNLARKALLDQKTESIKLINKLNNIKNTGNVIPNTRTQIYNLGGKKSSINASQGGAKGHAAPSAPPSGGAAHAEPEEESHDTVGGHSGH